MKKISLLFVSILALSLNCSAIYATDIGTDVIKEVQTNLNELGYDCGNPDGIIGDKTRTAIIQFQKSRGLEASGIIDDSLIEEIEKSSSSDNDEDESSQPRECGEEEIEKIIKEYGGVYKDTLLIEEKAEYIVLEKDSYTEFDLEHANQGQATMEEDIPVFFEQGGTYFFVSNKYEQRIDETLVVYYLLKDNKGNIAIRKNILGFPVDYLPSDAYTKDELKEIVRASRSMKAPQIGMTADEVLASTWGSPEKVNKTTTINGVHEQWVYKNGRYVYLDDGIVTAIQE